MSSGAVQLLRNAPGGGGGGGRPSVTLCDRGEGGSAERLKYFICIISYYNLYYCVCLFIHNNFLFIQYTCFITNRLYTRR